jgi:hypothetical protein
MSFRTAIDGQSFLVKGYSKTQVGHAVESGGVPITTPTTEKNFYSQGQAQPVIGHLRPATFGAARPGDANDFRDTSAPGSNK